MWRKEANKAKMLRAHRSHSADLERLHRLGIGQALWWLRGRRQFMAGEKQKSLNKGGDK